MQQSKHKVLYRFAGVDLSKEVLVSTMNCSVLQLGHRRLFHSLPGYPASWGKSRGFDIQTLGERVTGGACETGCMLVVFVL